jgi:hypothetical protein
MCSQFIVKLLVFALQLPIILFEHFLSFCSKGTSDYELKQFRITAKQVAIKMNTVLVQHQLAFKIGRKVNNRTKPELLKHLAKITDIELDSNFSPAYLQSYPGVRQRFERWFKGSKQYTLTHMNIHNLLNGHILMPLGEVAKEYQRQHFRQIYNEQTFSEKNYSFYLEKNMTN